jgi:hypothetical protein
VVYHLTSLEGRKCIFQSSEAYLYRLTSLEGQKIFSKFRSLCDTRLQVQEPVVHLTLKFIYRARTHRFTRFSWLHLLEAWRTPSRRRRLVEALQQRMVGMWLHSPALVPELIWNSDTGFSDGMREWSPSAMDWMYG